VKKWESIAKYFLKKNYIAFESYIAQKKNTDLRWKRPQTLPHLCTFFYLLFVGTLVQSTSYKCSPYECYFPPSVAKILLPKILQRKSVICYLLQRHTPFFVK
jgi:hypothetical protein